MPVFYSVYKTTYFFHQVIVTSKATSVVKHNCYVSFGLRVSSVLPLVQAILHLKDLFPGIWFKKSGSFFWKALITAVILLHLLSCWYIDFSQRLLFMKLWTLKAPQFQEKNILWNVWRLCFDLFMCILLLTYFQWNSFTVWVLLNCEIPTAWKKNENFILKRMAVPIILPFSCIPLLLINLLDKSPMACWLYIYFETLGRRCVYRSQLWVIFHNIYWALVSFQWTT